MLRAVIAAFVLQFEWEMAQMSAYEAREDQPGRRGVRTCGRAALGDTVITLVLVSPWALRRRPPPVRGMAALAATGAGVAFIIELLSLAAGRWVYQDTMPVIPGIEVGVWPVLQTAIIPTAVLWLGLAGQRRDTARPGS